MAEADILILIDAVPVLGSYRDLLHLASCQGFEKIVNCIVFVL